MIEDNFFNLKSVAQIHIPITKGIDDIVNIDWQYLDCNITEIKDSVTVQILIPSESKRK